MKIEGNSLNPVQPGKGGASGVGGAGASEGTRRAARLGYGQQSAAANETSAQPPPDEVSLSELSQQVNRLASADAGREARIDKLAADYDSGRLKADIGETARKLVDDAFLSDD
ncbi:MAG: flagellar biosynthesis anti-sigma factor FlgM [Bryobacterales bacterium]|nr:flagellar biosynthesis anti-sigma factor FlgM [Bryobacterales bacterium]